MSTDRNNPNGSNGSVRNNNNNNTITGRGTTKIVKSYFNESVRSGRVQGEKINPNKKSGK